MTTITITLPIPHKSLSSNARAHWAELQRHRGKARRDAMLAAYAAGGSKLWWLAADAAVVWYSRTSHKIDPNNMDHWLKAYYDGIADAGVVQNDRGIHPVSHEQRKDAVNPRVEITLTRRGT